jgi:aspartate/methionine/tyrosine aminotransferase
MDYKAGSTYLAWVKSRKPGQYNLTTSGVVPCSLAELNAHLEDIEVNGPSLYGYAPLQAAIAARYGVPTDCVVAASGASMANFLALAALVEPGGEVLVEEPVYEPLLAAVRYFHGSVRRVKRQLDTSFQLPALDDLISEKTKLIIVTNLHNPTSVLCPEPVLRHYGEVAASVHARVLVDEVYLECMYDKRWSSFRYGSPFIVTSSLTKAYGLGGLRCGWILADPGTAERMWRIKDLIDASAPHPAELLSVLAFRQLDRLADRAKTLLEKNRIVVREFLSSCDQLDCILPEFGTCIFPRLKGGDADLFIDMLHQRYDTDVVPGRFFELRDHFRLGIGMETPTLISGLERIKAALFDFRSE